jgi:DNA-binding transcriptional LysR family regulator
MMPTPRISLDQWRALIAVVEAGGYAQAAAKIHKSQSAVTYAVQRIEAQLGVKAFELQGRKARLTATGHTLYRRALALVTDAADLEKAAARLSVGWEAEIVLAAEILFPTWLLLDCLGRFGAESPRTRVEVIESVLGGTAEALLQGQADLAISPQVPPGFLGDPLLRMLMIAVASPDHPLHGLGRALTGKDLRAYRHVMVRDTGAQRDRNASVMQVEQRWTVSHLATAVEAVRRGHGFAWFPAEHIRDDLAGGSLKPLPLKEGRELSVELYLILADPDFAGPGVRRLAEIIGESVKVECEARQGGPGG